MQIRRELNLLNLLEKKSFFLFGPRSTGKTSLIRQQLAERALVIDLLRGQLALTLLNAPWELEAIINQSKGKAEFVVIDEVQKVPAILDEVHRLIEEQNIRFLLTGSSARKLKYGNSNLLAGRAWRADLFPLSWNELGKNFELEKYLKFGGLPNVYLSDHPDEELSAYGQTYLYEEVQAEGAIRKLAPFSRFLRTAALSNGEILNFTSIGSHAQISASTIREYYQLLEDTLLGFQIVPWRSAKLRKSVATAKFYFFDIGVANSLAGTRELDRNSNLYGKSFEHFIACEIRAYLSYRRSNLALSFWRSYSGSYEVDFIIGESTAVEVKSSGKLVSEDLRGLKALREEGKFKNYIIVSQDKIERKSDNISHMHWLSFLKKLWDDSLIDLNN